MSAWYWVMWAVVMVVNVGAYLASLKVAVHIRNLHDRNEVLRERVEALADELTVYVEARRRARAQDAELCVLCGARAVRDADGSIAGWAVTRGLNGVDEHEHEAL